MGNDSLMDWVVVLLPVVSSPKLFFGHLIFPLWSHTDKAISWEEYIPVL